MFIRLYLRFKYYRLSYNIIDFRTQFENTFVFVPDQVPLCSLRSCEVKPGIRQILCCPLNTTIRFIFSLFDSTQTNLNTLLANSICLGFNTSFKADNSAQTPTPLCLLLSSPLTLYNSYAPLTDRMKL